MAILSIIYRNYTGKNMMDLRHSRLPIGELDGTRLSNLTVSGKASAGAVVGTLSSLNASGAAMQGNFMLDDDCAGFFGVSGNNLVTMNASLPPGNYSVSVSGVGTKTYWSADGNFTITVTPT